MSFREGLTSPGRWFVIFTVLAIAGACSVQVGGVIGSSVVSNIGFALMAPLGVIAGLMLVLLGPLLLVNWVSSRLAQPGNVRLASRLAWWRAEVEPPALYLTPADDYEVQVPLPPRSGMPEG